MKKPFKQILYFKKGEDNHNQNTLNSFNSFSTDCFSFSFQNFREQCIDGSGLPLLTEDHLMNSLGMKLGPALKLRSVLLKKIGGPCPCVSCTNFTSSSSLSSANCSGLSVPNTADSPTEHTTRPASVDSGT